METNRSRVKIKVIINLKYANPSLKTPKILHITSPSNHSLAIPDTNIAGGISKEYAISIIAI